MTGAAADARTLPMLTAHADRCIGTAPLLGEKAPGKPPRRRYNAVQGASSFALPATKAAGRASS